MSQPNQQPTPEHRLGAHDFLNLEDELHKQNQGATPPAPGAPQAPQASSGETDSWLLGGPDEEPAAPGGLSMQPPPAAPTQPPAYVAPPQASEASVVSMDPVDSFTATNPGAHVPADSEQPSWLMELDDTNTGSAGHQPVIAGSQGYEDHMEPVALEATYAEEEPTSRSVSRAAGRGLLVLLLAAASVGGWQIHQKGGLEFLRGAITGTRPIQLERGNNGDELIRPESRTADLGSTGRQSVDRDGTTRPANTAGSLMGVGEPGELSIQPVSDAEFSEGPPEFIEPETDAAAVATLGELESLMEDDRDSREDVVSEELTQPDEVPFALTGEGPPLDVYPGEWASDPVALSSMAMREEMHRLLEQHLDEQESAGSPTSEGEDLLAELSPEPVEEWTVTVDGEDPVVPPVEEAEDPVAAEQDEGLSPEVARLLAGETGEPVEDVQPDAVAAATDEQMTGEEAPETEASSVEGLSPEVARLLAGETGDLVEDVEPDGLAEAADEQATQDEASPDVVASEDGLSPEVASLLSGEAVPDVEGDTLVEDLLPGEDVSDATPPTQDGEVSEEFTPVTTAGPEQPEVEQLNPDDWVLDPRHDLAGDPDDVRVSPEDDWLEGLDVEPDPDPESDVQDTELSPELSELLTAEIPEDLEPVEDWDSVQDGELAVVEGPDSTPRSDLPASSLLSGNRSIFDQYSEFLSTGAVPDPDQSAVASSGSDPVPTLGPDPLPGGEGPVAVGSDPGGNTDPLVAVGLGPDAGDPGVELPIPTGGDPFTTEDPQVDPWTDPVADAGTDPVTDPVPDLGGPVVAQTDPLAMDLATQTVENGKPVEERTGGLKRAVRSSRWSGATVPMAAVKGSRVLLTPNVGDVRLTFKNGETFQGRLHSVGQNTVWLETKLGRMTFDGRRVQAIASLMGSDASENDPNHIDLSTLDKVRVRTRGGYIMGYLLSQEGDQVTLISEEGGRVTVEGEVEAASDRRRVRGRKRTDG